ncbi:MAG: helix-turn-helix domain-containing protein [Planctomycetota bacterium]|jgi:DNA-binding NarL/FixJ family response regulator
MRGKNAGYNHNAAMSFSREQWAHIQKCYRFTDRKMQILKLLFEGLENDKIAKKLKIRYNTVIAHFGNIYKRVGVQNKVQLVIQLFTIVQTYNRSKMS